MNSCQQESRERWDRSATWYRCGIGACRKNPVISCINLLFLFLAVSSYVSFVQAYYFSSGIQHNLFVLPTCSQNCHITLCCDLPDPVNYSIWNYSVVGQVSKISGFDAQKTKMLLLSPRTSVQFLCF